MNLHISCQEDVFVKHVLTDRACRMLLKYRHMTEGSHISIFKSVNLTNYNYVPK